MLNRTILLAALAGVVGMHDGQRQAESTSSDAWITTEIQARFFRDPDVKTRAIDVTTVHGVVTLGGRVGSETERARAVALAREVNGVSQVIDRLETSPGATGTTGRATDRVDDAWITMSIQSRYFVTPDVKARDIDVTTENGVVTLRGRIAAAAERSEAVRLARDTEGVREVHDRLLLQSAPPPKAEEREIDGRFVLLTRIRTKLALDPDVSPFAIDVDVDSSGVVTLRGVVKSEEAKQRALRLAQSVEGVKTVKDELTVKP